MDTLRRRVLDTLARTLGRSHSIRGLTREVERLHGTAHYPNVHQALADLEEEGLVRFEEAGNARVPRLALGADGLPDAMAAVELWRKRALLEAAPGHGPAVRGLEAALGDAPGVGSVSLVDAATNLTRRRLDVLVLRRRSADDGADDDAEVRLAQRLGRAADRVGLRSDGLIVPEDALASLLRGADANPVPRMLRDATCLWNPQAHWHVVAGAAPRGGAALAPATPARLADLDQDAVRANLARYGYVERGAGPPGGARTAEALCPEAVAVAALAQGKARWVGAAAVVLAKAAYRPTLLAYLAKAEDLADEAAGLLGVLTEVGDEGRRDHTLSILEAFGATPADVDRGVVGDALDLYGPA